MGASRAMASLTIDAFRDVGAGEDRIAYRQDSRWIAVVAGHAFVGDGASKIGLIGPGVARTHLPVATFFRIPGNRKFDQFSFASLMQVGPSMVAGSDHVGDLRFHNVRFLAVEADLMATLEPVRAARGHRVITIGS